MGAVGKKPLYEMDHRCVIDNGDGTFSLKWNLAKGETDPDSKRVFSLQDDGSYGDRGLDEIRSWEKGKPVGNQLVFSANDARASFPWQP